MPRYNLLKQPAADFEKQWPPAAGYTECRTAALGKRGRTDEHAKRIMRPVIDRGLAEIWLPGAIDFVFGQEKNEYQFGDYMDWHVDWNDSSRLAAAAIVVMTPPEQYEGGDLILLDECLNRHTAPRDLGTVVVLPSYVAHCATRVLRGVRNSIVFLLR